ncbi:MAG: hypothetical protein ABEI53_03835 [Candidatus Magasanikbacteria bacterium]
MLNSAEKEADFFGFLAGEYYDSSVWLSNFFESLSGSLGFRFEFIREVFILLSFVLAVIIFFLIYNLRGHSKKNRETQLRRFFGVDNFWFDK